jgi:hypothetical protein
VYKDSPTSTVALQESTNSTHVTTGSHSSTSKKQAHLGPIIMTIGAVVAVALF